MNGNNLPNVEQAILAVAAAILSRSTKRFAVGSFSTGTSTGDQSVTGLPFKPRSIIFITTLGAAPASQANAGMGVGFVDEDGNQFLGHFTVRNSHGGVSGNATDACIYISTLASGGGSANPNVKASLKSFDEDDGTGNGTKGFTINKSVAVASQVVGYLAFE